MLYWDHWGLYWDPTLAQAGILLEALESILGTLVSTLEYWSIMGCELESSGLGWPLAPYWEVQGPYWDHA